MLKNFDVQTLRQAGADRGHWLIAGLALVLVLMTLWAGAWVQMLIAVAVAGTALLLWPRGASPAQAVPQAGEAQDCVRVLDEVGQTLEGEVSHVEEEVGRVTTMIAHAV